MKNKTRLLSDSIIWRYMDFDELLYIIATDTLYLMRPDGFDDPLEGFTGNVGKNVICDELKRVNVLCWHQSDYESEAMWRLYSRNTNNALAIKTDINTLCSLLPDDYTLEEIRYIDYKNEYPEQGNEFLYKRKSFEHERELRVIRKESKRKQAPSVFMLPLDKDDIRKLLSIIYISPSAPLRFNIMAKEVLDKIGYNSCQLIYSNELYNAIRY